MVERDATMTGVREYGSGYDVLLRVYVDDEFGYCPDRIGRPLIVAVNEGGFDATEVDLLDVIAWVRENHPEWLLAESP